MGYGKVTNKFNHLKITMFTVCKHNCTLSPPHSNFPFIHLSTHTHTHTQFSTTYELFQFDFGLNFYQFGRINQSPTLNHGITVSTQFQHEFSIKCAFWMNCFFSVIFSLFLSLCVFSVSKSYGMCCTIRSTIEAI